MAKRKDRNSETSDITNSESECFDKEVGTLKMAKKKTKNDNCFPTTSPIESDSDSEVVQPSLNKSTRKRRKRVKSDSEPEEGELTDSDSSDASQDEFNDGYASDLMGDEEDRKNLARMTEKERELELCRRADARDELKKRFEIEKRLRQGRKQELKLQKYNNSNDRYDKRPHSSLDLKERVLERKKTVEQNRGKSDKKFQAMNMLKARREEKREREEKEKEKQLKIDQERLSNEAMEAEIVSRGNKTKLKASDVYSDDSGSCSDERSASKPLMKETVPVSSSCSSSSDSESESETNKSRHLCINSKDQLNSIRLSRQTLEKLVHLPFFTKVVVGSYVRITAGTLSNYPTYKICEVLDVCETGNVYQLGNTRTNKGLRLRHGSLERVFRMEFVSNHEFTSSEFNEWKEVCSEERIQLPTVDEFERKLKDIQEAMSYEFKEEDVEKIVKEKEKFKTTPYNFAVKKTQLLKERDMAQSMGDSKKVLELQEQLSVLEEQAAALDKRRNSGLIKINYINSMNRRKNVEEAEKAILAELRASKGQRADDPFTRRHTKPSMVIKAKRPEGKPKEHECENGTADATNAESADKQENANDTKKGNPHKHGEDMYAAHDFEIKIDFDVPTSIPPVTAPAPIIRPSTTNTGKTRSLNLEDYKRRKGFI